MLQEFPRNAYLRNDLPAEQDSEDDVENLETFLGLLFVSVKSFQESIHWEIDRPQHFGGINQCPPKQTGDGQSKKLRRNDDENRRSWVCVGAIVQLLHGQRLGCKCTL